MHGTHSKAFFYGNMYTTCTPSLSDVQDLTMPLFPKPPKEKNRKYLKVLARRGYIIRFRILPTMRSKPLLLLSVDHSGCPTGEKSWCRWRNPFGSSALNALTTFRPIDIEKVKELFNTYETEEFCGHLALGLTQHANESLHNTILSLSP
ncbi:hypothetical protein LOD99_11429 [Oopsacas minuta]|uniref:Uncharacterized protein n=1 Tax=Oopsacas minuta TaxID=111878 RepID=A0AAV7K4S9_9METZ|nr:hypothetical protein LOD99_11429 [Oopsacas minuta]